MEIKDVRFSKVSREGDSRGVCGICSVNVGNSIVIHGVKVKRINGFLKVFLPERKVSKDGLFKPVVTMVSKSFKGELTEHVLGAYFDALNRL